MKTYSLKVLLAITACALLVGVTSMPTFAQEKTSALEAYAKWRSKALGQLPDGTATPHYSVAVMSRRLDATSAQLDFVVVGQMSGYSLEIQPVKLQKMPDGQDSRLEAGELSTSRIKKPIGLVEANANPIHEFLTIIPTDNTANAIEVKWTPEGIKDMSCTLVLPLEDAPSTSVIGIITSCKSQTSTEGNFRKVGFKADTLQCRCYVASGSSARCGDTLVACCASPCARFDFTRCTVTCCTKCPRGDCCDGTFPL